ncbi:MAG: homeostatic response regulator transcription factor HsrA [Pseudomonadota bacterium]|nr:homeostatic response regulator transcription factor HsrA [Pseudomonadota bacterium]
MRILIIDNDTSSNITLKEALNKEGYQSDIVERLRDGKYYLDIRNYNLVLLNEILADEESSDFIKEIKTNTPKTAIIVISDKQENKREIEALLAGADDYIRKPFDIDVFMARIEARLRFFNFNKIIKINDLTINTDERKIFYKDQEVNVTGKPYEVFVYLAQHRDQIVTKEQILDALWVDPELVTPQVIDVAINQIRQRVDKPFDITTIETVNRRGYRFSYPKNIINK